MSPHERPIMYGEPINLDWCGWRSDTRTLAHHGWDVSAQQGFDERFLSIAVRFPRGGGDAVYGFSDPIEYDFGRRYYQEFSRLGRHGRDDHQGIRLSVQLAHRMQFNMMRMPEYLPIDAEPSIDMSPEIRNIEDLAWFRTLPDRKDDLIITPPTMQELMQTILDRQAPDQDAIRKRAQQRNNRIARVIRLAS